ncbi:MAG: hypothetical protein FJ265_14465 [Planctomycetes bacterium]|nr:hypothetical protein [Planctomycetota bacterium]
MRIAPTLAALAAVTFSCPLAAQQIIAATSGLPNPTRVIDFGANLFPNFTPVSTQFPGLTITHAAYFTTGVWNNLVGGFLTNNFSAGLPNTLRVQFASPVTGCSFVYHQISTSQPSTIRVLLQGVPVDSFSGTWNQSQPNNYFGFQNLVFDELQIDFVADFNFDTLAVVDSNAARCVFHNGSLVNPPDFTCATLPVLGTTWQGLIAGNPNTVLTFLAYAPAGLAPPSPLFGGELLIGTTPAPIAWASFGSYAMAIPAGSSWTGTVLTFQGFRVDSIGPTLAFVPLNANDLVLGL